MKTNVEVTDPIHRLISIEIPWEMISEELDREYDGLSKKVSIKGFRKGKIPRSVLRQRFSKQVSSDVIARLVQDAYEAALVQNRIRPVAIPDLQRGEIQEGTPYKFTARVEVQPEIELKQIQGFDVQVAQEPLNPAVFEQELENLRASRAVLVPIEGRTDAQKGDVAIVDYVPSEGGAPIPGGKRGNQEIELGSGRTLPGFDEGIVGMNIGETRGFELDVPSREGGPREGGPREGGPAKRVHFQVTLTALRKKELPALDDELAKDLGETGVETAADVRAMVERRIREGQEARARRDAENKLFDQLIQANPFPVPPSLVERQKIGMLQELQSVLQMQGVHPDRISADMGKILADLGPRAEREVAIQLLLNAVAEREKIEVSEADVERHMERVAKRSGEQLARLKALYNDQQRLAELRAHLRREKVVEHLMRLSNMNSSEIQAAPPQGADNQTGGTE